MTLVILCLQAYIAEPDSAHYMASVVLSGAKPKVVFFESFQVTAAEDGLKYLAFKVLPQAGKDGGACIPADAIIDPHEMFGWSQDLLLEKYLEAATGLGIDITKSTSVSPLRMALTMLKLASFMPHAASLVLQGLRDKDMAVYAQGQMQLDRLEREMRKLHRFHQELQREHDIVSRHREDSMACWLATLEPRMSPATPSHEGLTSDPDQQLQSKDVTP
ncbi:hypothetical protein OEZ85_012047 [Tetradesmus obliquus]|uniref:Uncharacterized protein n=1 Tax=Tetradesmus obliquus TaxID=3088 RepID=A0ABY8TS82_TETOB|nr:hypothetical protein OEZ85_012047 [Tetradesmus obliquus]